MRDHRTPSWAGSSFYARVFTLVAVLALGLAFYRIVEPFLSPIIWAMFFAFLLHPLDEWLTRRLGNRPHASAVILTIMATLLLIGPITGLGIAFAAQAAELVSYVEKFADTRAADVRRLSESEFLDIALAWLNETWGVTTAQLQNWAIEGAQTLLRRMAAGGSKFVIGAVGTIVGLGLMVFLLFFFVRDGEEMVATARQLIPMREDRKALLFDYISSVTRAVVFGVGLTALIQGTLVGVALAIVGVQAPLVFGVLAVLFSLLPVGGSAFIWVPAAAVLALQQRWGAAIFLVIWGALLVGTVDNFLRPLLISGRAQVATLTVFIGVLGGVSAFGAIGLFLGPVVVALIIALIRFAIDVEDDVAPAAPGGTDASIAAAERTPPPISTTQPGPRTEK
ncbi:MAG TPA: AI-2E family transporter [Steroidobacteraceae bacterium]|nr:AI-2E family transporter [Steroidobacteraceae bacterium]